MLNLDRLLCLTLIAACSPQLDGLEADDAYADVVLQPDTILLDTHTGVTDITVGTDQITLTTLGWMAPLAVGSVVVGQRDGGYLRRVTEVLGQGDRVVLRTEPATLGEAVLNGEAHAAVRLNDELRSGQTWDLGGRVLVDETLWSDRQGDYVDVTVFIADGANITLDPTFDFDLELFNGSWVDAGFSSEVTLDYEADFVASASGAYADTLEATVFTREIPFAFNMGPVPVVGTATIEILAGLEANFAGEASVTLHTEARAWTSLGARYDGDWWSQADGGISGDMSFVSPSLDGTVRTRVWLRARFEVELYGSAGADLELAPWLEAEAVCGLDGVAVDGGLTGSHGYHFDALGWDLFSWGPYPFDAGTWDLLECATE